MRLLPNNVSAVTKATTAVIIGVFAAIGIIVVAALLMDLYMEWHWQ